MCCRNLASLPAVLCGSEGSAGAAAVLAMGAAYDRPTARLMSAQPASVRGVGLPTIDVDRPPLSGQALAGALTGQNRLWREIVVLSETGSTNAVVAEAARAGAEEGLVVVAEQQRAGRGRLGRRWTAPARSAVLLSVLLRPGLVPASRTGWLPLLAGVALAEAVEARTGLAVRLKWPNDLLAPGGGKLAGILAERVENAVVLGMGLNVSTRQEELAGLPEATSLALAGATALDRAALLRSMLEALATRYLAWREAAGRPPGLPTAYAERCATLDRQVRLRLPAGPDVVGHAVGVDEDGRLVVRDRTGTRCYAAADVVHLRAPT